MIKVTYVTHDGAVHEAESEAGLTVMETAVKAGVPGIDADCGGACACATCHVYVDEAWGEKTGSPSPMEESMLDFASERDDRSRLSCQIKLTEALDGLKVTVPEFQG